MWRIIDPGYVLRAMTGHRVLSTVRGRQLEQVNKPPGCQDNGKSNRFPSQDREPTNQGQKVGNSATRSARNAAEPRSRERGTDEPANRTRALFSDVARASIYSDG
ncbi:hypothetical protein P170DRAFT_475612 [Aspergillus steynii IBT 23096]|uniref:Uncharacterized protein n=1 Tax=Aspergillus steynii IBT 23096 TaxID=1392250 RepID=A0A2I2G8V3_9EURO|nr:uncharacterized protein P170DRAFT_475612 [Aspergillus steynii IBT 23096]PLB49316.1 hypothetical protein P170DRAFT_475612 [Aspergillus steynii IBT 23096]